MTPTTEAPPGISAPRKKPRLALAIATALGVGYIPKAPGTFGAMVGSALTMGSLFFWFPFFAVLFSRSFPSHLRDATIRWLDSLPLPVRGLGPDFWTSLVPCVIAFLVLAMVGVWSAWRVASYAGIEDPQYVVIDEVSGQHLTYLLGLMPFFLPKYVVNNPDFLGYGFVFVDRLLNWKYLLMGFILFRVFDIWKPWPIRRLEKLPGGWGIMADDWMAGIYAAILLRLALHFRVI